MSGAAGAYVLSVAVPRPLDRLFTYRIPEDMLPSIRVGGWVKIPFGRSVTHGYVVERPKPIDERDPDLPLEKIKDILEAGDPESAIPEDVMELCRWASRYYQAPLGEVLNCAAPAAALGLRSRKREARQLNSELSAPTSLDLTADQRAALESLDGWRIEAFSRERPVDKRVGLLHGITGSGKTEVYLELARRVMAEGKGVIILVPEIALTPQLHRRLSEGLGDRVGLWHSALPDGQRRDMWAALKSGELKAVVGARSTLFAPIKNLGLIVIDEEHDQTYKQDDRFRYHARDLSIVRATMTGAYVVLGSATPSIETLERVREGRFDVARLPMRIGGGGLPTIDVVDLGEEECVEGTQAPIARRTLEAIKETLASGKQVMVFLNRRGFAAFLVCEDCGETEGCPDCSVSLTVHKGRRQLRCHQCGFARDIPVTCPKCHGERLKAAGAGTESLEEELPKMVEGMTTLRLDRDVVTSASRLERILDEFREGKANTLLGTQMLVKGHDFPGVTLVVVVLADALFRMPDFRAPEQAFQVLTQVAGRAGRGADVGKVLIQTYDPDHPVIQVVKGEASESMFLESERELRQALRYPPFARLARLRFESDSQEESRKRATAVAEKLFVLVAEEFKEAEILGPSEAFVEKIKGTYRWDILIKAVQVAEVQKLVHRGRQIAARNGWQILVDIDPVGVG